MAQGTSSTILEIVIISVLNIIAVYIAAFTYKLNWGGVVSVMVFASLLTAGVTHVILAKANAAIKEERPDIVISEGLAVLGTTLISSLAVLMILTRRFNLPEALGIALTSGILTSFIRSFLSL